jgi:hypothetical protein
MKDEIDKLMESQSKEVKLVLAPNLRREGTCLRRIGAGTGAILKSSLGQLCMYFLPCARVQLCMYFLPCARVQPDVPLTLQRPRHRTTTYDVDFKPFRTDEYCRAKYRAF